MNMSAISKTMGIVIIVIILVAIIGVVAWITTQPGPQPSPTPTTSPTTTPTTSPTETPTETTTTTTTTTPPEITIEINGAVLRVPEEFRDFVEKAKNGEINVTIYFGHALAPEERDSFIKVIDMFMQEYPGINVVEKFYGGMGELQSSVIAIASLPPDQREALIGNAPDVFTWAHDWVGWFADSGYIIPLEDYIGYDAIDDIAELILPTALSAVTYETKTYGLPYAGEALALYVNTNLVSEPPTTFEEMKQIMEQFYNPSEGTYGIAGQIVGIYHINAWVTAHGGFFYDDITKQLGLTKPETIEGVKFFVANILRYMDVSDLGHDYQRRLFGTGKVPFYISGPWDVKYAVDTLGIDSFTVVPFPKIGDKVPKPFSGFRNMYLSVMAQAGGIERTYASILFVLYVALNDEALLTLVDELGYVPVKYSVADYVTEHVDEKPLYKIILGFYNQLMNSIPMPKDKNMQTVWGVDTYLQAVWQAYAQAISEGKTPDEAVEIALEKVEQALQDAYNEISTKIE
ncbi:MAG: ABC transporter substrate-binding protein [Thermoprotei archaeon]|nr:MAG: ABC transporter substrate-binding protein [Thermoprotei archaeon]